MKTGTVTILKLGCVSAAVMLSAACSPRHVPLLSVADLMEDRVTLDGVLMKCNSNASARNEQECVNARIAIERLARQNEPERQAKSAADFEHNRELLRQQQERVRAAEAAKAKVDAYHLPVVPVDPPGTASVGQSGAAPLTP